MKNIFCLFDWPFKIQKNGVFLFEISFFVLSVMTSYCLQLKMVKYRINEYSALFPKVKGVANQVRCRSDLSGRT